MWEISNYLQITGFLYSIILGGILAVFYDILRAVVKAFSLNDTFVFFKDILFFLISALVTFCFLLSVTNGEIRIYVLFGLFLGFILIKLSISALIFRIVFWILKLLNIFLFYVNKGLSYIFDEIELIFQRIFKNIIIFLKKYAKYLKKT